MSALFGWILLGMFLAVPVLIHDWLTEIVSDAMFEGLAEAQEEFDKGQAVPKAEVA